MRFVSGHALSRAERVTINKASAPRSLSKTDPENCSNELPDTPLQVVHARSNHRLSSSFESPPVFVVVEIGSLPLKALHRDGERTNAVTVAVGFSSLAVCLLSSC